MYKGSSVIIFDSRIDEKSVEKELLANVVGSNNGEGCYAGNILTFAVNSAWNAGVDGRACSVAVETLRLPDQTRHLVLLDVVILSSAEPGEGGGWVNRDPRIELSDAEICVQIVPCRGAGGQICRAAPHSTVIADIEDTAVATESQRMRIDVQPRTAIGC